MNSQTLHRLIHPPDLAGELQSLLVQIPAGRVTSFGDLAEALGDLTAARWVAKHLQLLDPEAYPVHRVVRRTGLVVGTEHLPLARRRMQLVREGVRVADDRVDLGSLGWRAFSGSRPLSALRKLQQRLAEQISLMPSGTLPERVAGVDVSYRGGDVGVAAYTVVDTATGRLLHQATFIGQVSFPYIPGYLSFRELPLYVQLLQQEREAGQLEPWLLVDGNGILHPRRSGIASLLGCVMKVATVGVSKHLLYGKLVNRDEGLSPILSDEGSLLGYRFQQKTKRSALYVSPGHGVDVTGAWRLARSQMFGHRLPEPLHYADRLSRAVARGD